MAAMVRVISVFGVSSRMHLLAVWKLSLVQAQQARCGQCVQTFFLRFFAVATNSAPSLVGSSWLSRTGLDSPRPGDGWMSAASY
jgi:hypothetical protein